MSQKMFALVVLGLIGGFVVAIVKAQDLSRSVYGDETYGDASASGTAGMQSSRRGSLADRVRSVRESASTDYDDVTTTDQQPTPGAFRMGGSESAAPLSGGGFQPAPATPMPGADTQRDLSAADEYPAEDVRVSDRSKSFESRLPSVMAGPVQSEVPKASQQPDPTPAPAPANTATNPWQGASSRRQPTEPKPQDSPYAPPVATNAGAGSGDSIALVSKSPIIHLECRGPKAVTIGKEAAYTVSIHNMGTSEATGLQVALHIPAWVQVADSHASIGATQRLSDVFPSAQLVWLIDRLEGRSKHELAVKVVAGESRPFDFNMQWASAPVATAARVDVQEPKLQLALSGPSEVPFGQTAKYTVTLLNPGTGDAEDVMVKLSQALGGKQITVGRLAAGSQKKIDVDLTARQAGETEAYVEASAAGGLRAEANRTIIVRRAVLAVKTSGPQFQYAGSIATYRVKVSNSGDATAQDVMAAAAWPSGAEYVGGIQDGEVLDGGLRWTVGSLPAGTEKVYEIQCKLLLAGENRFETGARAAGDLTATDAVSTTVEALADLDLLVTDPRGPQPINKEVSYELNIRNRGTKAARDVRVVAQFSEGIEPVTTQGGRADIRPGQAIFDPIDRIEAGGELKLIVTAKAERAGNHVFRIEVRCEDPETRRISEGTTRFFGTQPQTSQREDAHRLGR